MDKPIVEENEKRKRGRPSTGGRNPANWHPDNWKRKTPHVTTSITGKPEEIAKLKQLAKDNGKTVSRYVIESLVIDSQNLTK